MTAPEIPARSHCACDEQLLPQLISSLPSDIKVEIASDRTQTIRASVTDVQITLVLTIALVVGVIFLFLRNVRATPPAYHTIWGGFDPKVRHNLVGGATRLCLRRFGGRWLT
ncbi:hypothetical protein ACVWWO_000478 [Bradyrhizobium sp. F1.13.1]